jgi:phage/plasmid primase-like uncharacterized protein
MAAKAAGLSFEDFHNWSKDAANYSGEKDCLTAWNSFDGIGEITAATLFHKAIQTDWKDSSSKHNRSNNSGHKDSKVTPEYNNTKNTHAIDNIYALEIWQRCSPADNTYEYIFRKQGTADGLKIYPVSAPPLIINNQNIAGYLVVPCLSDEKLQTLHFIPPNCGDKLHLPGAAFNDGYFVVGQIDEMTKLIYICEGIGHAWAINQATNAAAVVCFGASRMMRVAKVLRGKKLKAQLIIVPDRGQEGKAAEIASAVGGQWIEPPQDMPPNYDVNDYALEFGHDALALLLEQIKTPEMRYKLLSGEDLLNAPPMRWIVHGVLPAEGLAALYGASGSGKSFLILDMGLAIATGDNHWFGRRIKQSSVTYVCLEGEAGIGKRIKAWCSYYNKALPDALRFITQPFNLLTDDVTELAKAVTTAGGAGGVVIIDTLMRATIGTNENSSDDMGKIIAAAEQLQKLIGGLVILVHHTGKDSTKGLRGHSSLYAALDGAIEVVKSETRREWSVAKSKDDVTGDSNPFKLEIVNIGLDDQGHEITSCVALFDNSKAIFPKTVSLGCNQKIAWEEINKLLINSPHIGKDGIPPLSKCIHYEEAVLWIAERIPADAKHQKSRAISAIAGLVGRKYLAIKGNWLWKI